MEEKYSKSGLLELSKEKLTFQEIITISTFIERLNHHCGEDSVSDECGQDEINSNLAKRIAEIRNESNF